MRGREWLCNREQLCATANGCVRKHEWGVQSTPHSYYRIRSATNAGTFPFRKYDILRVFSTVYTSLPFSS